MKFHLFYALGWNHCCSYRFLGPKWVKNAYRALEIKKINNFTKNQKFQKILIIGEIYEIYWFSWFRPKKPAPGLCFGSVWSLGRKCKNFYDFLIFFMKNNISDDEKWKNQKKYENHVFRQSFNRCRDGKGWKYQ